MAYILSCRLHSLRFPGVLRKKIVSFMEKHVPIREFSFAFISGSNEKKYEEIRSRLSTIPCSYLLNKEVDKFMDNLWDENDVLCVDLRKRCLEVFNANTGISNLVFAEIFLKAFCVYGFSMKNDTWNQWDSESWKSASILGWCLEIIASYINILDDVVDQSIIRRGKQCWYKNPDIGLSAIHDSQVLLWSSFSLFRKQFSGLHCYMEMLQEFMQENLEFAYGQVLDIIYRIHKKTTLEAFTFERYKILAEHKAGQYFCRLPVHLAMHLTGGYSKEDFDFTKNISLKLSLYFQMQNDRFDYVFPKEHSGIKGHDIRNGTLTWFTVKFFEDADDSMKKEFMENYGINDENAVETILELYKKSNMLEKFQEFESQLFTEITTLIESKNDYKGAYFYYLIHLMKNRIN